MKRTSVEETIHKISQLYLKGMTPKEVATQLDLSIVTVRRYTTALNKRWRESAVRNIDEAKNRELEKLDVLEAEYWKAWEESKKGTARRKEGTMKRKGAKENFLETGESEILSSPGDPKFLDGVARCIKQRAELLGLNAATRVESDVNVTARVLTFDASKALSLEERANIVLTTLQKARDNGYRIDDGRPDSSTSEDRELIEGSVEP